MAAVATWRRAVAEPFNHLAHRREVAWDKAIDSIDHALMFADPWPANHYHLIDEWAAVAEQVRALDALRAVKVPGQVRSEDRPHGYAAWERWTRWGKGADGWRGHFRDPLPGDRWPDGLRAALLLARTAMGDPSAIPLLAVARQGADECCSPLRIGALGSLVAWLGLFRATALPPISYLPPARHWASLIALPRDPETQHVCRMVGRFGWSEWRYNWPADGCHYTAELFAHTSDGTHPDGYRPQPESGRVHIARLVELTPFPAAQAPAPSGRLVVRPKQPSAPPAVRQLPSVQTVLPLTVDDIGPLLTGWTQIMAVVNRGRAADIRIPDTEAGHRKVRRMHKKKMSPIVFPGRGGHPHVRERALVAWLATL